MTIEAWSGAVTYLIQGTGPYAVPWPFDVGALHVSVTTPDGAAAEAAAFNFAVSVDGVMLGGDFAAHHAGQTMTITRRTHVEQKWQGLLGERERGLERQLDTLAMAIQEREAAEIDVSEARQAASDARAAMEATFAAADLVIPSLAALKSMLTGAPVGAIIATRAEGYSYQVVAADPDVTTAGGVMLRVLETADGLPVGAFGTIGDGVADDTAAIQTALSRIYTAGYARARPVILGPGTYLVSAPLRVRAPNPMKVYLRGAGQEHTTIKAAPTLTNSAVIWIGNSSGHGASKCAIENLTVDAGGKAANNTGILYQSAGLSRISHVTVQNARRAIWMHGCIDSTVEDCNIFTSYEGVFWTSYPIGTPTGPDDLAAQASQTTRANISRQLRCWLSGIEATATWISGGSFVLAQSTFQACTTNGIANVIHIKDANEAYSYGGGPVLCDNWVEGGAYRYAIFAENTRQLRILRNHLNGAFSTGGGLYEGAIYLDAASTADSTVEGNSIRGYYDRAPSGGRLANASIYAVAPARSFRESRNYAPYNNVKPYYHGEQNPLISRDMTVRVAHVGCSSGVPVVQWATPGLIANVVKNGVGDYTVQLAYNRQPLTAGRHFCTVQAHATSIATSVAANIISSGVGSERIAFTQGGTAADPAAFTIQFIGGGSQ